MTLIEQFMSDHTFMLSDGKRLKENIYYFISNNYGFIYYMELDFNVEIDELNYAVNIEINNKYTQYVFSEDLKIVSRLHKIYRLLGKNIIAHFNTLSIVTTITINNTNDF